jgi:hypothetical protein
MGLRLGILLALVASLTLARSEVGIFGEYADLVMNGPNIGMPDFFIYPKLNGNRTGQYYRFTADYVALINTSDATAVHFGDVYAWEGSVSEIVKYDLLSPSLVWTRQDNVTTFNGSAINLRFCSIIGTDITICADYWLFLKSYELLFNYTGQPRGFVYYYSLPVDSFKFGVTVMNWQRNNPSEWFRISIYAYTSAALSNYNSVVGDTSWILTLIPSSTTAALLNLTLLNFVEDAGALKYLVWSHNFTQYNAETFTPQGFHYLLDADIQTSLYYDPDMRTFFNGLPGGDGSGGSGDGGGGSDNTILIVLVSVLVPLAVVTVIGVTTIVGVSMFIKRTRASKLTQRRLEAIDAELQAVTNAN